MSQSPQEPKAGGTLDEYRDGWKALRSMLTEGRSFSGRERHCCFLNTGNQRFADVSAITGLDLEDDGRGVALVDWDHDGDLDIWISNRTAPAIRFLRNTIKTGNHFLALRLQGTRSNPDAVGARVEVSVRENGKKRRLVQTLRAGEAFRAQSSKQLHFGLGAANQVESMVVHWPGGTKEQFEVEQVDSRYLIVEGSGRAVRQKPRSASRIELTASQLFESGASDAARIVLARPITLPSLKYATMDGQDVSLATTQQPLLINLWAGWCSPCVEELKEWGNRADELQAAGVKILLLNVEGIENPGAETARQAKQFLEQRGLSFEAGMATHQTLDALEDFQREVLDRVDPLPLPTSFLVDTSGKVMVFYKGTVAVDQLLDDLHLPRDAGPTFRRAIVPFDGRWIVETPAKEVTWRDVLAQLIRRPLTVPLALLFIGFVVLFVRMRRRRNDKPADTKTKTEQEKKKRNLKKNKRKILGERRKS